MAIIGQQVVWYKWPSLNVGGRASPAAAAKCDATISRLSKSKESLGCLASVTQHSLTHYRSRSNDRLVVVDSKVPSLILRKVEGSAAAAETEVEIMLYLVISDSRFERRPNSAST